MASSLKSRLARIRERASAASSKPGVSASATPDSDFASDFASDLASEACASAGSRAEALGLLGWLPQSPGVWQRERRFELPEAAAPAALRLSRWRLTAAGTAVNAAALGANSAARQGGSPASVELPLSALSSFDLETTGLSGGAGTVAFLAAFGGIRDGAFLVRQYFMDDYPAEPGFLAALGNELESSALVLSYNGASFDLPLYRTRCVLNGIKPVAPRYALDLLHPARRLWRRKLPDCALGTIEREVLGIERGEDLPGSLVPEAYFRFLREGVHRELELAMDHNASDVYALVRLFLAMERALDGFPPPLCDTLGLASLVSRFDRDRYDSMLEAALAQARTAGEAKAQAEAAALLMRSYWRQGRKAERLSLAPCLIDDARGLLLKSLYEERLADDRVAALAYAESALVCALGMDGSQGASLTERARKRIVRLRRLAARPGGAGAS